MKYNHIQINTLARDFQNGDQSAFTRLYDAHIRMIYDFIYYKTHHKETAEDLTSITFTKAFEKISQFDEEKASFKTWLYRIAYNTIIDHYRKQKPEKNIEDAWDLSSNDHVDHKTDMRIQLREVEHYLKQLTAQQRTVIIMRVWEDMSYKEISEALDMTESNAKMTFSRGIKKLRSLMPLIIFLQFIINIYE